MHPRRRRSGVGLIRCGVVLAGMASAMLTPAAVAQVDVLPTSMVQSSSIGSAERDRIGAYVSRHAPQLTASDFAQVKRSRDALLDPLTKTSVSVAFRQAYAQAAWPVIEPLLDGDDPTARLTGMRLAGALATERAASALLDQLETEDEGLRIFAVGRLEGVLSVNDSRTPAISASTGRRIVSRLGEVIENDPQVLIADAAIRALRPAASMNPQVLDGLRQEAVATLARHAGRRVAGIGASEAGVDEEIAAAVHACALVRNAIADAQGRPTEPMTKEAIGLGGDALAFVVRHRRGGAIGEEHAEAHAALVAAAEAAVYFGRLRHAELVPGRPRPNTTSLEGQIRAGDDRAFLNQTVRLLQNLEREHGFESGRFTQAP